VDQVLMGLEVKLLKKQSYWYLVQTPYAYLGWITQGTLERISENDRKMWHRADKYVLNINFDQIFTNPDETSQVICDMVLGSVFIKKSQSGKWVEIELPDGRLGYVKQKNVVPYNISQNGILPDGKSIIARAKKMMGIPYLWGGHSTKGMDCSGFTGTVFNAEGYRLPRDANMQVKLGEEVIPDSNYSNIRAGDLIFFGPPDRITHVGICLGGSYFIHSSGDVHINSLDPQDELFNDYRKRTFRHIKRIIKK
jgi:hypothetical protein